MLQEANKLLQVSLILFLRITIFVTSNPSQSQAFTEGGQYLLCGNNILDSTSTCSSCVKHKDCTWCPETGLCLNTTSVLGAQPNSQVTTCPSPPLESCIEQSSVFQSLTSIGSQENIRSTNKYYRSFEDIYARQQWAFEMINVRPVWEAGIFGTGIRVRVNDDGVDRGNSHWGNRFDENGSCSDNKDKAGQHGTTVASIIAAAGDQNSCSVGIANGAILSNCYALVSDEAFLGTKVDQMDISQNSFERPSCKAESGSRKLQNAQCPFAVEDFRPEYDPCKVCNTFSDMSYNSNSKLPANCREAIVQHCSAYYDYEVEGCSEFLDLIIGGECMYTGLSYEAQQGIVKGITEGRNGLGVIYVFASGNSYFRGDDTNLKGYTNSRMTISVGAVGKDRMHAYYSTSGASIFVSAPVGDANESERLVSAKVGGGCTDAGIGTSFAAPVVSGVIALILEANSGLGWRDVQAILAESSTPVTDDSLDASGTTNGAGYWHSNFYGFGIINAAKAVELAQSWTNLGEEKLIAVDSGDVNLMIYDTAVKETTSSINVQLSSNPQSVQRQVQAPSDDFIIESVEVLLDLAHISRGDLSIKLTSPSGTESLLHPGKLPENLQLDADEAWKLMTVRSWGESPYGEWKLTIVDEKPGQLDECVDMSGFMFYYTGVAVDCPYVEKTKICLDGKYNEDFFGGGGYDRLKTTTDDKGRTMADACCDCGGGFDRSSFSDELRHWTIAIYGRQADGNQRAVTLVPTIAPTNVATPEPTLAPTTPPTNPPTQATPQPTSAPTNPPTKATPQPTIAPTNAPTQATPQPTAAPTQAPTNPPTSAPTRAPSVEPTVTPTEKPSMIPSLLPTIIPTTLPPTRTPTLFPTQAPSAAPTSLADLRDAENENLQGTDADDVDVPDFGEDDTESDAETDESKTDESETGESQNDDSQPTASPAPSSSSLRSPQTSESLASNSSSSHSISSTILWGILGCLLGLASATLSIF